MNLPLLTATVLLDFPTPNGESHPYTVGDVHPDELPDLIEDLTSGKGFVWLEDGEDLVVVRATRVREIRVRGGVLR